MYRSSPALGRLRGSRSRLGDSGYVYATGPNAGQAATGISVLTDLPPDPSDIFNFPATAPYLGPSSIALPSVSPSTLLAAANLPNAPAVVKQAAAQYSAANPVTSWFSGSMLAGIPNYLLAGGGLLLLLALSGGKRRR
ncbi:MAG: hypothetical protein ACRD20_02255 [Terriglobales bacterium]